MLQCQVIDNPAFINAQLDFTFNILQQNGLNSSTIFSPISLTFALAMIYFGAKENSAKQIRNVFGKDLDENEIHCHFSSILSHSKSKNVVVKYSNRTIENQPFKDKNGILRLDLYIPQPQMFYLDFVNRIYARNGFKPLEKYVNGIRSYYNAGIKEIDFSQADSAAFKINKFVADFTNNKIQDIVDPSSIDDKTKMILINAIYFKAYWQNQFITSNTFESDFYSSPKTTKKVMMMSTSMMINRFKNDEFEIAALPYEKHKATMYIILPNERFGLQKVIKNFNTSKLIEILTNEEFLRTKKTAVKFPRFKIESSLNVVETLENLGITDIFSDKKVDLSGITGRKDLSISDIKHKAFIETNEEGTEAAAASGFSYIANCRYSMRIEFTVDHPFMFIIADENLNILFAGTHF
uniref:Serpin domain-containing protein n=1 Tax=Panagrolaimus davidi TaxID=227884 RepID=A0A914Q337_9BILA